MITQLLCLLVILIMIFNIYTIERESYDTIAQSKILIVNLPRRKDRRERLKGQLDTQGINNYLFIDAVDGRDIDIHNNGDIEDKTRPKGVYGCYLSHMKVWDYIVDNDLEYALVLEDDVNIENDFINKVDSLIDSLKSKGKEWDILYIGINCFDKCIGNYVDDNAYYITTQPYWGTQSYIIKKEAIMKISDNILPINIPIDVALMDRCKDGTLKCLSVLKQLTKVNDYNDSETI